VENNGISPTDTIFRNSVGGRICHDNFSDRVFARDAGESGVRRIRFHDLRHTATTMMIADGLDIKTVQEICGHASILTTMKYLHLIGSRIKEASKQFSITAKNDFSKSIKPSLRLVASR